LGSGIQSGPAAAEQAESAEDSLRVAIGVDFGLRKKHTSLPPEKDDAKMRYSGLLPVLLVTVSASAQGFSFKGNALGMTLDEFKRSNATDAIWINTGTPGMHVNKKLSRQVSTPLCSDTYGVGADLQPGEVFCDVSPGVANPEGKDIAGEKVARVDYRFMNGRLYRISMPFASVHYAGIRGAFIQRYGSPTRSSDESFQNAYGARWTGEILVWSQGSQSIVLREGSQDGPAQNRFEALGSSTASFEDTSLAPQNVPREKPNF
jgi:hypothetical protein